MTSDIQMTPPLCRKWRGTKKPLDESERGKWKSWLKTQHSKNEDHDIWSHHFMANRWEKNETRTDFICLGSKITVDGDCRREIKRHFLLERKVMANLDHILKSRDITLLLKVHIVKVFFFFFPVFMYGCETWTIKKAEHQRTDGFELWYWRRLLRIPWTARRSSQFILKEINPGYSLEGLMLKLKLQYFGHLMGRPNSFERPWCWERLTVGEEGDDRGWDDWMASPTHWTWVWESSRSWWWIGKPGVLQSMGSQRVGHDRATELSWTENNFPEVN